MAVREGYKQTEIGVIPENWEVSAWGEILECFSGGATPYRAIKSYYNGRIKWITSGELKYNIIYDTLEHISEEARIRTNLKIHPAGTFLMAITGLEAEGTRGSCGIIGSEATTNQSCLAIYGTEKLLVGYLYHYYLKYGNDLAFKYCQGTKQQSYTAKIVKQLPICYPKSTKEQKAIATALSDIDGLINSLTKLIEKKKHIKQGAMQELLTGKKRLEGFSGEWVEVKLGDIAIVTMGQSPDSKYYNTVQEGLPLIQGNADIRNRKTIIRNYTSQITRTARMKDIIMTVRAPVGYIGKATSDCCIGRGVCSISYKNDYLYYYFISIECNWNKLSAGSTFDSVSSKDINDLPIIIPTTIEEQTAIATILSDMDSDIETLQAKLDKYKAIKQGMMQELLTGRIRILEGA